MRESSNLSGFNDFLSPGPVGVNGQPMKGVGLVAENLAVGALHNEAGKAQQKFAVGKHGHAQSEFQFFSLGDHLGQGAASNLGNLLVGLFAKHTEFPRTPFPRPSRSARTENPESDAFRTHRALGAAESLCNLGVGHRAEQGNCCGRPTFITCHA
jgi:hypothetical protein